MRVVRNVCFSSCPVFFFLKDDGSYISPIISESIKNLLLDGDMVYVTYEEVFSTRDIVSEIINSESCSHDGGPVCHFLPANIIEADITCLNYTGECGIDNPIQSETLSGIWNLRNANGGLQGINIDYNEGDVKWDFNIENNRLIVENNILTTGPENIYSGLASGTYDFMIQQNGDTQILLVEGMERGGIILSDGKLTLDGGISLGGVVSDAITQVFER